MFGLIPLLFGAPSAQAQEAPPEPAEVVEPADKVTTSVTEDFEIRYYQIEDPVAAPPDLPFDYVEQVSRLNLHASKGNVTVEAQIDQVALFGNQYYFNDVLYNERRLVDNRVFSPLSDNVYLTPEKLRVRIEGSKASWTLGDSYAAFGRGIALNLNRNVDIDLDTSIQGAKAVFRPGAWDVTVVVGQLNRQQVFQDNPNIEIPPDLRHGVAGVRVERFGLGPANLGLHGVAYDFVNQPGFASFGELGGAPDAVVGGATAELMGVGGIDWYLEGDVFGFPTTALPTTVKGGEDQLGYAGYLSASFYPGRTVWLVEAKRYYQAERVNGLLTPELYEVGVAPTLEYERAVTEDSGATLNSNDIWGGRVQVDFAVKPGEFVPYAAMAVYRDEDTNPLNFHRSPETVLHPVVGMELIKHEGAALINAGYRVDHRDDPTHGADRQLHGDAAIKFPFVAGLHAEIQAAAEYYQWGENEFQQADYVEVESGVTVQRGSTVAVTWYTDYTTNPLVRQNSTGNLTDALFGAAEIQVKPTDAITLKAFYGAYKSGIRCSGGQCRQLPGFEGVRFSFVGAF